MFLTNWNSGVHVNLRLKNNNTRMISASKKSKTDALIGTMLIANLRSHSIAETVLTTLQILTYFCLTMMMSGCSFLFI